MKLVSFSLEEGNKYFASIDGMRFFVGTRVNYMGGKGLMNLTGTASQRYNRSEFRAAFGFWADLLHPTAAAEGALFHTLNTYDRAHFTFSFLQYAAHVPNGDFVAYLRSLLQLPLAVEYFPDLEVKGGRICRRTDTGSTPLETDLSTAGLIDYLNPSRTEVEDTEIIQAARFIHWVQNDPLHRKLQVTLGVSHFKASLARYVVQYGLDGADDITCLLVADIRHQGRAKSPAIVGALRSADPVQSLLAIGEQQYPERIKTLRREIKALVADETLGRRKYSRSKGDFVLKKKGT